MKKLKKILIRMFLTAIALTILLSVASWVIVKYYGDTVEQKVVTELNKTLDTRIQVGDVQLDLLSGFPLASVKFSDISSEGQEKDGSKLVKAGEISVLFNIADIFKGDYTLIRIRLKDAFLNLYVNEKGSRNYEILKKGDNAGSEDVLNLEKVFFSNVVVSFIHVPSRQEYLFRIDKGKLVGSFSSKKQGFNFDGTVHSRFLKSGNNVFLKDSDLEIKTEILLDQEQKLITINSGELNASGVALGISGTIKTGSGNRDLDLEFDIPSTQLSSVVRFIPPKFLHPVDDYALSGKVVSSIHAKGNFKGDDIPEINIQFALEKGTFQIKKNRLTLKDVSFNGMFTNGSARTEKSFKLELNNIHSGFGKGIIEGDIRVSNFKQPLVETNIDAELWLEEVFPFINSDTLSSISGKMDLSMGFSNRLQGFRKFNIHDFISSKTSGKLHLEELTFGFHNNSRRYSGIQGSFEFNNKDLLINSLSGNILSSDFNMTGYFSNLLAYLFLPGESLYVNAKFASSHIKLDEILEQGNQEEKKKLFLQIPEDINFDLSFEIDQFNFRSFESFNNTGSLKQSGRILYVKETRLQAMDGHVNLVGNIDGRNTRLMKIDCRASFGGVDITKLFAGFRNFGQDNILSQNLKGKVNAEVKYKSTLSPGLYVDPAGVYTLAQIEISKGELIGYRPLYKLSGFVRNADFEHITFSTIKNEIKIENEVVYIPRMNIESSSMNLGLSGQHAFDNLIDYKVDILLADVLARKEKKEEELGDNFVKDDGYGKTRLFLKMTGPAENPDVRYDSKSVSNKIAGDLKKEGKTLKELMKDEFGGKKTDSTIWSADPETDQGRDFKIEWEENSKDTLTKKQEESPKNETKKESDFIIIWDEDNDTIDLNTDPPRF